jgi:hypothetical protein
MNLSYTISPDRRLLTISADEEARKELASWPESTKEAAETGGGFGPVIHTNAAMHEAFERLIANSELEWILPEVCGDLTDAPILGVFGERRPSTREHDGDGEIIVGWYDGKTYVAPVLERWGYMDYCLQSPLVALRDTGKAVFTAP